MRETVTHSREILESRDERGSHGLFRVKARELPQLCFSAMSPCKLDLFFVFLAINVFNASESADKLEEIPPLSAAAGSSPVFKPAFPFSLLPSFPEDLEISDYCSELLHIFGQRYVAYANCLVPAARPVKVCQSCFSTYSSLTEIYGNISSDQVRG